METDEQPPLTLLLRRLQEGDRDSIRPLWDVYFERLMGIVRRRISSSDRMVADEEDIALSAFKSFCLGAEKGKFQTLKDRDEIWSLLVTITMHKALRHVRDQRRLKRGGQWQRIGSQTDDGFDVLMSLAQSSLGPEMEVRLNEDFEALLRKLDSTELVELVEWKLQGFTNAEIAGKWNKAERTVERKLSIVRQLWQSEFD